LQAVVLSVLTSVALNYLDASTLPFSVKPHGSDLTRKRTVLKISDESVAVTGNGKAQVI
jgi:hypothetical protein